MKQKSPPPPIDINAATLAQAIATGDDFAHEMHIKAVLKRGARVQHGWSYLDPIEAKPRQFDLRARLEHRENARWINMAVEGKNFSAEMPLVVSGTARTQEEGFHHFVMAEAANGPRTV